MNRRGFLKGLTAIIPVAVASTQFVETKKAEKLTDLEIAQQYDKNFNSPHLYVKALNDVKQGDAVIFGKEPYTVCVSSHSIRRKDYIVGIAVGDIKQDSYGFIQTIGNFPVNYKARLFT
jgi:hypothetical protein